MLHMWSVPDHEHGSDGKLPALDDDEPPDCPRPPEQVSPSEESHVHPRERRCPGRQGCCTPGGCGAARELKHELPWPGVGAERQLKHELQARMSQSPRLPGEFWVCTYMHCRP